MSTASYISPILTHHNHAVFFNKIGRRIARFLHFYRVFEISIYLLFGTSVILRVWSIVEYEGDLILLGGRVVNRSTSDP